jgi:glutamate-5-semialdehyde dehydrogenase
MKQDIIKQLKTCKHASQSLLTLDDSKRNQVLETLAEKLQNNINNIISANAKDLALMDSSDPRYDRLLLNEARILDIASDLRNVASLTSNLGKTLDKTILDNGLTLKKVSVPLGVVSVIYESRPNVTIDVFSLCFKTSNACVLKGGKEALHSNQYFVSLIQQALTDHQLDSHCVYLLPSEREATQVLLEATGLVDVCIPRGSQQLIHYVRENAIIPFIETGAGIVHTYFDESGDTQKGQAIITNAKLRRVSVCNALDTLIIHKERLNDLPMLVELLALQKVELFADEASYKALGTTYPKQLLHDAKPEDFGQEFLSYKLSIKTVSSISEAVNHIKHYSSGHSEAIIANDKAAIEYFLQHVDAAAVYVNASTAFTDGAQFGLGAEIGISTQKLHARGPMALDALTSYKWIVLGDGQIRN